LLEITDVISGKYLILHILMFVVGLVVALLSTEFDNRSKIKYPCLKLIISALILYLGIFIGSIGGTFLIIELKLLQ
jgi:hypothetical protein